MKFYSTHIFKEKSFESHFKIEYSYRIYIMVYHNLSAWRYGWVKPVRTIGLYAMVDESY